MAESARRPRRISPRGHHGLIHLRRHERIFDTLKAVWQRPETRRAIGRVLIIAFFVSVGCIELARQGWVTEVLGRPLPTNHLAAIAWVFTLLLI
ncbi:MAG: hypothetical protein VXY92_11750, partial [Planctomycetota bacterium]|nr:hypothetical protein [Planctomycetota bacterium]